MQPLKILNFYASNYETVDQLIDIERRDNLPMN